MKENFEFDKLVLAIALSIFTVVFSINVGGFLYRVERIPPVKGYVVEIVNATAGSEAPRELPAVIQIGKILAAANVEAGKQIFNKCAICHTGGKGEPNKVGPNLWGIISRQTAQMPGFAYSPAMEKLGSEGHKWTYEELYRYLFSPKKHVPGTKMAFAGLKKDEDRANLIVYLRTLADSPLPLPTPEIDATPAATPAAAPAPTTKK
ncbi:MAG: c-type cytochrome [Rickettsiales bacterium]